MSVGSKTLPTDFYFFVAKKKERRITPKMQKEHLVFCYTDRY